MRRSAAGLIPAVSPAARGVIGGASVSGTAAKSVTKPTAAAAGDTGVPQEGLLQANGVASGAELPSGGAANSGQEAAGSDGELTKGEDAPREAANGCNDGDDPMNDE